MNTGICEQLWSLLSSKICFILNDNMIYEIEKKNQNLLKVYQDILLQFIYL